MGWICEALSLSAKLPPAVPTLALPQHDGEAVPGLGETDIAETWFEEVEEGSDGMGIGMDTPMEGSALTAFETVAADIC